MEIAVVDALYLARKLKYDESQQERQAVEYAKQ